MNSLNEVRRIAGCVLFAVMTTACQQQAPKGQVLATVNGEEVTVQDVATERRNTLGGDQLRTSLLLQRVVDRVLLAQAAHARKLDTDPDYPADLARVKQDLLARRMLELAIHAPAPPTAAQVTATAASHPYQFENRARIRVDQLGFRGNAAWTSVHELGDIQAVVQRLNGLGVPFERVSRVLDTAELPADLAAKLYTQPLGKLFFIRQGEQIAALVETERASTPTPIDNRTAIATQLLQQQSIKQQTSALISQLTMNAKIRYQPGYKSSGSMIE